MPSAIIMKFKEGQPVQISAKGIPGKLCHKMTKPFEDIIGGTTISSTDTAEASLPEATTSVKQKIRGA